MTGTTKNHTSLPQEAIDEAMQAAIPLRDKSQDAVGICSFINDNLGNLRDGSLSIESARDVLRDNHFDKEMIDLTLSTLAEDSPEDKKSAAASSHEEERTPPKASPDTENDIKSETGTTKKTPFDFDYSSAGFVKRCKELQPILDKAVSIYKQTGSYEHAKKFLVDQLASEAPNALDFHKTRAESVIKGSFWLECGSKTADGNKVDDKSAKDMLQDLGFDKDGTKEMLKLHKSNLSIEDKKSALLKNETVNAQIMERVMSNAINAIRKKQELYGGRLPDVIKRSGSSDHGRE